MLALALLLAARADEPLPTPPDPEVLAQIDWQGHPAMHLTWDFFTPGLTDRTPRVTWDHTFTQVAYRPWLEESGVRIFVMAAMAAERATSPELARAMIVSELDYVEAFVAAHPEGWALAKTPAEARAILRDTDKRVVIHSIEGGHMLLSGPDDARFWADRGVALVTLVHLRDDEFGGAGILPRTVGPLINPVGARRRKAGERRGLTERGAQAIVELDQAGILVDLTHMSPATVDDALLVTAAHGISPVATHGKLARLRDDELALRDDQVVEIYRQGGVVSLGLSPQNLGPLRTDPPFPADVCPDTLEVFAHHTRELQRLVVANADAILGSDTEASERATRLAVGWSSDWNGWVQHGRPAFGPAGCRPAPEGALAIDTRGLAHPGLLPEHWQRVEEAGVDLTPMLRSAERFLQLWEEAGEPAR